MPWDDELEGLSQRVKDVLGVRVYHDAMRRAMGVALRQSEPVDPDSLAGDVLAPH